MSKILFLRIRKHQDKIPSTFSVYFVLYIYYITF